MPTDKKAQDKEAAERQARGDAAPAASDDPRIRAEAEDAAGDQTDDDTGDNQPEPRAQREAADDAGDDGAHPQIRRGGKHDDARAQIVKNFRTHREETDNDAAEDAKEIRALTNDGMPPELVQAAEADDAETADTETAETTEVEDTADDGAVEPKLVKVTIRGEDRWVTEEQLHAAAQKGLAGDDYLDEAKDKAKEASDLLREARTQARTAPDGKHPAAEDGPTDGDGGQTDAQHQGLDPKQVIHKIQFGDEDEAVEALTQFVRATAASTSQQVSAQDRSEAEVTRSRTAMAEFAGANPELAKDPLAVGAITSRINFEQQKDLTEAGIDTAQFKGNPNAVAAAHLRLRTEGNPKARTFDRLLTDAKTGFEEWRGVTPEPKPQPKPQQHQQQQPAARTAEKEPARPNGQGKVVVNVSRTERRERIAQSPSRTVAPKPQQQAQAQAPRDRSQVVADMKAQRARGRGQVVG